MQMLRAKCRDCAWTYDCVSLPMETMAAATAIGSVRCPMCGNGKGNTIADPRELTPDERRHKETVLAYSSTGARPADAKEPA